ncbi:hypothetical protein K439DRAFT_1634547 [Ramaria rubella]|nr:hypothetical protein K439DRAFT_1634547 [Ramaria rubella]
MDLEINSSENTPEWCVRVDYQGKSSQQFTVRGISDLFQSHVGVVGCVSESMEAGRKWMKVAFRDEDDLKKAMCMSGYSIGDASIQVSMLCTPSVLSFAKLKSKQPMRSKRVADTRRNLYVLNVPHDLSAQAYHDLFTPHGKPTHTVLLKTQDSCSRRRGFVVMSTHDEAQDVINWLDGICISGFQLRVTWANIDRSNGFASYFPSLAFAVLILHVLQDFCLAMIAQISVKRTCHPYKLLPLPPPLLTQRCIRNI